MERLRKILYEASVYTISRIEVQINHSFSTCALGYPIIYFASPLDRIELNF